MLEKYKHPVGLGIILFMVLVISGSSKGFREIYHQHWNCPKIIDFQTNVNFQLVTYQSQVLGIPRTYGVALPVDYQHYPERRYPVIFLLHGGHGNPTNWFTAGQAIAVRQQLNQCKRLPDAIIITPDGYGKGGSSIALDPVYTDNTDERMITAIGDELAEEVQHRYRTKTQPHFWAIGGLSSGGWGAVNIGLHKPHRFAILFSHSGYFIDKNSREDSPMFYIDRLSEDQRKNLKIYLDAGEKENGFQRESREFHQKLDNLGVMNEFNVFPGGHRGKDVPEADKAWNYWHKHLTDSLGYVGDRLREAELEIEKNY